MALFFHFTNVFPHVERTSVHFEKKSNFDERLQNKTEHKLSLA